MNSTPVIADRSANLFAAHSNALNCRTDRLFAGLMICQYLAGIAAALWISPRTWAGAQSQLHAHVWAAVVLGGFITALPVTLALIRPGRVSTRHVIAVGQTLTSALLIHLSGGRIETHFHVFGSLAFLAFYRDWRVLITASAIIAVDHLFRGIYWPQSVFGVLAASPWRWLEHAGWVTFECGFLIRSCIMSKREMIGITDRQASLEATQETIEAEVLSRTSDLSAANRRLVEESSERSLAEEERDRLNVQLAHAQKLETVGQLAAGIAHEINTPTQYVGDNTRFLQESFAAVAPLLEKADELVAAVRDGTASSELAQDLKAAIEEANVEYLRAEIPRAIGQSLEGIERVSKIVRAMKDFSHPGVEGVTDLDLNHAIESTITVATNEWKYVAEMETDFDPELPLVPCVPGEFNQVVLNMVVNAAHAIADVVDDGGESKGTITVSTRRDGESVEMRIADTGSGIPEEIRGKIFDPFFTTKEIGKGTGQGLSIAHGVVVQKHGGTIDFETEMGKGTTFIIRLPLVHKTSDPKELAA